MMKTIQSCLSLTLIMLSAMAVAQDYAFKVLANKGTNEVKRENTWQPLKTGFSLKETDELKLAENSYVGLVHKTGKPIEIKQAGSYKIADIKVSAGSSVLVKYTDFILSSNSAEGQKNKLSATGAVDRGDAKTIQLLLPENQSSGVFNTTAIINWTGSEAPYVITFKNMFDDVLEQIETTETQYRLDLTNAKYAEANAVLIEVRSKKDSKQISKQHLIKKLSPAEHDAVRKSLNAIASDITEPTAINKFIMAGFFEENKLYIDAIAAYEEAVAIEPSYKEAYEDFMWRHGIKKQVN